MRWHACEQNFLLLYQHLVDMCLILPQRGGFFGNPRWGLRPRRRRRHDWRGICRNSRSPVFLLILLLAYAHISPCQLPRIQQVFSIYCARHHRAILKLGQLAPSLKIKTYSTECQTLRYIFLAAQSPASFSFGNPSLRPTKRFTVKLNLLHPQSRPYGSVDLASLLIKPVQRVLKYPMLLASILAVTPSSHPDRISLERACTDILMVADHINEDKTRELPVVLSPTPGEKKERRSSTASSLTKKLLGGSSSRKSKTPTNAFPEQEGNDMFDTLSPLVDSTRSSVLRIETEMREHVRKQLRMLESHASMVDGWIEYYSKGAAPMLGSGGYERLCTFLDTVLRPLIAGAWRDLVSILSFHFAHGRRL